MEFKSQIATTREQSEKLLALGIKPETADCHIEMSPSGMDYTYITQNYHCPASNTIPSWSLTRLLELIPKFIYPSLAIEASPPYISYWNTFEKRFEISYGSGNIYENAIFIISWLIKNNHFNTEYLK